MTHERMAPLMGLIMGAMIPLMVHGPMAGAGLAFVAAHVAVVLGGALLVLLVPAVQVRVARRGPSRRMMGRIILGVAFGFAVICLHCLVTWHGSAIWT